MTKKAIKILLALAVTVTMFVVVTVVASAGDYVAGYNDADGYWYLKGERCESNHQLVYIPYPSAYLEYSHVWFPDLCDSEPSEIYVYSSCNIVFGDTEDIVLYPDDIYSSLDMMGYDEVIVYYNSGEYFHVKFINSIMDLPGYGSGDTNDPDDSGNSGAGSGDSGGSSGSGSSDSSSSTSAVLVELMDGTSFVYDPEMFYRCTLGFTNRFLPVFYIQRNVEYHDLFYDLYYYANRDIGNYHDISEFTIDEDTVYALYFIENGKQSNFSQGQIYEDMIISEEGTVVVSLCFECDCDYHEGKFYSEFWFCLYVVDDLPYVVPSEGDSSVSSPGGYLSGYNKGYDEGVDYGYSWGYNDGELHGIDVGKSEGYDNGYAAGNKAGYKTGYDAAVLYYESPGGSSASYQQGYQDALEIVIDTDGDAISGFFTGITGSTFNALDYITNNVYVGSRTLFDIVEFIVFCIFGLFVVKLLWKLFSKSV